MFLKSIEVRGFKSFADKTDLIFKKGITAVVGPNGSGKSNISDAVRWVLGEQSVKSLRGGKMEDIIFAGTQFRKPVGVCQVALTLDNTDGNLPVEYSDVTISRRLYRSGDSEYYINNTQCRLKDVQELFMDTGIGKEGYSIIGQGKIDAVLSGKAEERRGLLEEAAGIVKFKWRKQESEKRLENTEQNLIRLNDILVDYEDRLEPLKNENEKAKIFVSLSGALKEKEIRVIMDAIDKAQLKGKKQEEECKVLAESLQGIFVERTANKEILENWNQRLDEHEKMCEKQQQKYYENKEKVQKCITEVALLNERIENVEEFTYKANKELEELEEKSLQALDNKISQQKELEIYEVEQKKLNEEISYKEKEMRLLHSSLIEEDVLLKNLKEEDIEILSKISECKNNILMLKNEIRASEKKIEELKSSCENYLNSIQISESTKKMLEVEIQKLNGKIISYEDSIKDNKELLLKISSIASKEEQKLKELNAVHNKVETNYQILNSLEKQYEGYNRSIKILMQDIDKGKVKNVTGQCFILGEIIEVKKELEVAVQIALGAAISDVITTNEEVAKGLINYLKENNIGRATFLPLNIIKDRRASEFMEKVKGTEGFLGIASDLITYEDKFAKAIGHILGRTLLCSTMETALEIARLTQYRYKIVTVTGEVVNPGGSLTGGSLFSKSLNIIGRKREIEELLQKSQEIEKEIKEVLLNLDLNKVKIKESNEAALNLKDKIHFQNIEVTKLQGKIQGIVTESQRLKNNYDVSREEVTLIKKQLEKYSAELLQLDQRRESLINTEKTNEAQILFLEEDRRGKEEKIQQGRESLTLIKVKRAQVDEILINRVKELERLSKELESLLEKKSQYTNEVKASSENKEKWKKEIDETVAKMAHQNTAVKELEQGFAESELNRIKIKENIKIFSSKLEENNMVLENKEEEKRKVQIAIAKVEMELEGYYIKLNEDFEITYAQGLAYKGEYDIEQYKKDIIELKGKINELGTVNIAAIEAYSQLKEKFTFLSIQREDLIKAKLELLGVIEEMTNKMKLIFKENFTVIRQNFDDTFKELFKGGSADLVLCEGDELTANIEISVQPPGKKLQNINLMSGGEKVLSAIALLFAILKMKPTPFCILDEIEAALDDANVVRYAEFLKKFSHSIQFIVITHRKGTMEVSDVLYGVTMEEKGISKVVSVTLN